MGGPEVNGQKKKNNDDFVVATKAKIKTKRHRRMMWWQMLSTSNSICFRTPLRISIHTVWTKRRINNRQIVATHRQIVDRVREVKIPQRVRESILKRNVISRVRVSNSSSLPISLSLSLPPARSLAIITKQAERVCDLTANKMKYSNVYKWLHFHFKFEVNACRRSKTSTTKYKSTQCCCVVFLYASAPDRK